MVLKDILKTFKDNRVVAPLLDRHLLTLNGERDFDGFIHPSSVMDCSRRLMLRLLKVRTLDYIEPRLRRIFSNGDDCHHRIQKWLLEAGATFPSKTSIYGEHTFTNKKWRVQGSCDGILKVGPRILEIKSINKDGFYSLQGPKPDHLWQGHMYMWLAGHKECIFFYECKDNQDNREFLIKFDDEIFETAFERIRYVNRCFEESKIPTKYVCLGNECGCQDVSLEKLIQRRKL